MEYAIALSKAWDELEKIAKKRTYEESFLREIYKIDMERREVLLVSRNAAVRPYLAILILHYVLKKLKGGLAPIKNEWVSFKELAGGDGYYPAFKKRVIDVINRKFGTEPEELAKLKERFGAREAPYADASVVLETFERVPLLIELWRPDGEFEPESNILFDKSIADIFCTEDIAVLAETVAHGI